MYEDHLRKFLLQTNKQKKSCHVGTYIHQSASATTFDWMTHICINQHPVRMTHICIKQHQSV